jgi:hypothetical protein
MAAPKIQSMTKPKTVKMPAAKFGSTPQIKNNGFQAYLQSSKMKPLMKTIAAQLNS